MFWVHSSSCASAYGYHGPNGRRNIFFTYRPPAPKRTTKSQKSVALQKSMTSQKSVASQKSVPTQKSLTAQLMCQNCGNRSVCHVGSQDTRHCKKHRHSDKKAAETHRLQTGHIVCKQELPSDSDNEQLKEANDSKMHKEESMLRRFIKSSKSFFGSFSSISSVSSTCSSRHSLCSDDKGCGQDLQTSRSYPLLSSEPRGARHFLHNSSFDDSLLNPCSNSLKTGATPCNVKTNRRRSSVGDLLTPEVAKCSGIYQSSSEELTKARSSGFQRPSSYDLESTVVKKNINQHTKITKPDSQNHAHSCEKCKAI